MANTTTTTTSGIDPEFKKYYATLFNQAGKSIFSTDAEGKVTGVNPFQQYQGEQIAGFTPQQLAVQQQMAQLQTPQGFQQGAQGLNQSQQMASAAATQGLNQAFGYQPQAPASLAIPQQSWFPSGSNQPQMQQPQQPVNNGNGGFGPPKNEPRTPDNGNGGFGPPAPDAFTQGMQSTRSGTSPHMQAEINRRLALRGMPTQTFADGGGVNTAQAYNTEFSRLNPQIPLNQKWDAAGQQSYLQQLVAKNPTQYKAPGSTFGAANTPVIPEYQNMGVGNVGGQTTFTGAPASPAVSSTLPTGSGQGLVDNRLASRGLPPQTQPTTGQVTPISGGSNDITFDTDMGMRDTLARQAAPGYVPNQFSDFGKGPQTSPPMFGQQPPPSGYTNAPGGFGHAALLPNTGQQPVNNGNGGFGPPNPSAPAFGQQPDSSAYESKYQQGVTDIALRGAQKQAELLKQQNAMGSIGRGTFGGARQALMQTEGDYNNAQNLAAIQAMGSQAGFQNAQQQFNADRASNIGVQTQNQNVALQQQQLAQQGQQFQAGLGRDIGLAGLNAGIGSSTNLGNLSAAQQQGDLARLQMQGATAAQQQALQQQINDRNMQNYYTAQQYPMQQLDRYGNILRGGQGAMGTVGTTTTPQGSIGAQLMGAGIAGLGLYGQNAQAINNGVGNIVSGVSNWWDNI